MRTDTTYADAKAYQVHGNGRSDLKYDNSQTGAKLKIIQPGIWYCHVLLREVVPGEAATGENMAADDAITIKQPISVHAQDSASG